MKRLTDEQLESRINSFLTRKFEELALDENPRQGHLATSVTGATEQHRSFRPVSRFSLRWHHA